MIHPSPRALSLYEIFPRTEGCKGHGEETAVRLELSGDDAGCAEQFLRALHPDLARELLAGEDTKGETRWTAVEGARSDDLVVSRYTRLTLALRDTVNGDLLAGLCVLDDQMPIDPRYTYRA